MRLAPLSDYIRNVVLNTGRPGWLTAVSTKRLRGTGGGRRQAARSFGAAAEALESRALLAGPQLVTIAPNTGGFLASGQLRTDAPRELVFTFSPGATIDPTTIDAGITVTRAGSDGVLGTPDDVTQAAGYAGLGPLSNQVTYRFADALADDLYRVRIDGDLRDTNGDRFNSGVTRDTDFRVDFGGQVVSVVPQPVSRGVNILVGDTTLVSSGDRVTIDAGSGPVTFEFLDVTGTGQVRPGNIPVNYTPGATAQDLANSFAAAFNASTLGSPATPAVRRVTATPTATGFLLSNPVFTPRVTFQVANAGFLAAGDGALTQARNAVVVHFNDNELDPDSAQNPAFYQLNDVTTGRLFLPSSVSYDADGNNAVLLFAADLPNATYRVQIGAPQVANDVLARALNIGTLYANTGAFEDIGYLGDKGGVSDNRQDVDLYTFRTGPSGTTATITSSDRDPSFTAGLQIRVFNAAGTQIAAGINTLNVTGLSSSTQYYVGISAAGNAAYNPVTENGLVNGTGTGTYRVQISGNGNLSQADNTSSFATATGLGTLGRGGFVIDGTITVPGNSPLYPPLPGMNDEPGHRQLPLDGESNDAPEGTTPVAPSPIPTKFYNFQTIYGTDPQGNQLFNAITEAQKNRAREIFEIFGRYVGMEFVETADQGMTIATGDPRAVAPEIPLDGVGGIYGSMDDLVIINSIDDFGTSPYGGSWFNIAFHEIGHALGLAHSYDAPGVMGQGFEDRPNPNASGTPTNGFSGVEPVYPGDVNLVPARNLMPVLSTDVNLYQFDLDQPGTLTARAIAQELQTATGLPDPSLLDPVLSLYQETYTTAKVSSFFGTLSPSQVKVTFTAKQTGVGGNAIAIAVSKAALGAGAQPQVSVSGTTINVVLNTTLNSNTTAQQLINAINNNASASALVLAELESGAGTTNIAAPAVNYSPIRLAGGTTTRTLISRNDDYRGRDSLVSLSLAKGRYFIAVSSTGNTSFDPTVSDTGYGGRTDGDYRLDLNFEPAAQAGETLNDLRGIALDGDLDYKTGGSFEFWFKSADTIFVDKANQFDVAQDGSLANPYSNIATALAAAAPGQIVRIVGNSGGDGDSSTTADNLPYLIGFDATGAAAEDGSDFIVPGEVTVMIDAGAILKLRSAIVDVGKTVPNIDRSGAALQVLGTPGNKVQFTSLANDAIGGRSDSNDFVGAEPGNWGGVVFRQSSDYQGGTVGGAGLDYRGRGVFLNSVNQANMTFGGGQVVDDSVLQVFTPVHIENMDRKYARFTRPNVWFNTISQSADAPISSDPNSFANTLDRSGPFVRGNTVTGNSVNAFFIRVRTNFGEPVDTLQVPARIDDIGITYVLPENLFIEGLPGGPYLPDPSDPTRADWDVRLGGSLVLDPGVILKLSGSRIQTQIGSSQFLAEGTRELPVVLTSLRDDTFGAGGTFDTSSDGSVAPAAGDWAGLFFAANSSASLDYAVVQYAGGVSAIAGNFDSFNPVAIQQADARIANSLFQFNAGGLSSGTREGLLDNSAATIFIRGSQPVVVNNTFVGNGGNVLSVNVNALNSSEVSDYGRSTGLLGAVAGTQGNTGPLVRGNRMDGNGTNGMEVRGERVTTEVIFEDSDIVHVVRDEIIEDINRHTFGGVRLQSGNESSLVVKLLGANAGFTVTGTPLDITDRIGGTLQVIGSAQYPVILTSLNDDSVGAGFRPDGLPLTDTDGDGLATPAAPGQWRSLRLDKFSNDRNVAVAIESEVVSNPAEQNGTAATAQFLGSLAPQLASDNANEKKGGNDYQPYGYEIRGVIANPGDQDVYSFTANTGTEIWVDISRTSLSLDTVVEIVDANNVVLATSNDSQQRDQSGSLFTGSLMKDSSLGGDYYTQNPKDAGMRVVLTGANAINTYFVRVRSNGAQTAGQYNLQVRIRQLYEAPGSTVRFADVRFATNGIEVFGLPGRSPLAGDAVEIPGNNTPGAGTNLGNLLASDMASLSVSGNLSSPTQVDWYQFTIGYDLIQSIGQVNNGDKTWATMFDIDYADGLVRPDAVLSVFDSSGQLILVSRDSNVADDQPGPNLGNGLTDMSRGTVGKLDPFIGTVQMPTGGPNTGDFRYFVAVSSNAQLPSAMNGTFTGFGANGLTRLEPINSVRRIVEDHLGFIGHTTGMPIPLPPGFNTLLPYTEDPLFPIETLADLDLTVTPFTLADVQLYGLGGNTVSSFNPDDGSRLYTLNNVGGNTLINPFQGNIKMRSDGRLFAYRAVPADGSGANDNKVGQILEINTATGAATLIGDDAITDANFDGTNDFNELTSDTVNSFAWTGNSDSGYQIWLAPQDGTVSKLYSPDIGSVVATDRARGRITGAGVTGTTNGMAFVNGQMFGVSSGGQFYRINLGNGAATLIKDFGTPFRTLTEGPRNLENGRFANFLFATTFSGQLVCFDLTGTEQPVFNGDTDLSVNLAGLQGIAFSPLDFNLWHPTGRRGNDAGHGINRAFDNSRNNSDAFSEDVGGVSYYFGMEPADGGYLTYPLDGGPNAQYGVQNNQTQRDLGSNPNIAGTFNMPGGANGSLITPNSFSLVGYDSNDKPTLYFNYFLQSEDASSDLQSGNMRDSARVYLTTDDGATWQLLATNNQALGAPGPMITAELPPFASASRSLALKNPLQRVQQLYDNTGGWRQARIDLADFVGLANIRLRFDFSTAGAALVGQQVEGLLGDAAGVGPNGFQRAQNNLREGFFIDDIIVGLAERGEMVTGAPTGLTSFTAVPINPNPLDGSQSLTGAYQLEIRRGEEVGEPVLANLEDVVIRRQFDTNDRLTAGWRIQSLPGSQLSDGQTFTISDGVKTLTFEFDSNNALLVATNRRIAFAAADTAAAVSVSIRNAVNAANTAGLFAVTAELSDTNMTLPNNTGVSTIELIKATSVGSPTLAPEVRVTIPSTFINENAGTVTATVTRSVITANPLTVNLAAFDAISGLATTAVNFPGTVTIPGGSASTTFTITAVNNTVFNGTRTFRIQPTAAGHVGILAPLDVRDDETGVLTLSTATANVTEGLTRQITISRGTAAPTDLTVTLTTLDATELSVPLTVVIPATQASTTFVVTGVQDGVVDGNISASIAATAATYSSSVLALTSIDSGVTSPALMQVGANVNISRKAGNQSEGAIIIDRTNPQRLFMASNDLTVAQGVWAARSTDGGATWTTRAIGNGTDGFTGACCDPTFAADEFGNLFLGYLDAVGNNVVVLLSTDFGATFSQIATLAVTANGGVDQPTIRAARHGATGSVWITWQDFGAGGLVTTGASVTALGTVGSFSTPSVLPGTGTNYNYGDIVIGPAGQVVATYQSPSGGEGPATIFVNTDPDGLGPQPFGAQVTVTTTNVGGFDYIPAQPNRSVDAEAGLAYDFTTSRLYLVYTDEIGAESNNLDIRLRFSDNNGATWSNFVRVNDDLGVNSQFLPRIAVDNAPGSLTQGFVAVSWYDTRNDLAGNNDAQFYTTYSNTQGASFAANVRVSSGTSNADNANDGNDYGDYTGLDFWNGAWYPLWADNGNTIGNANAPTLDQATARVILIDPVVQPNLTVTIVPTSIAEGGAGATATITRGGSTAAVLVVTLTSSDPTIATIQPTVTIPAGQASVSVPVNSVVSPLAITRQAAIITATATGFDSQSDVVDVTDATVRALTVTLASGTVAEGAQITGTVRRNTPTTEDLIVTLFVTDSTEAVPTPVTVTILAGDATADFALDGVQDFLADGTRQLAVVAAAPNHDSGRANLSVTNTAASFATSYNRRGDTNTIRDQGQIQIYGNAVSQVSQFGILVDEAQRGGFGPTLPLPGSVISTPTLNSARLLPGVNISNNQVTNFGQGGIRYEGSGSLQPLGSVPFGRIVNNTVYGGATATGVGIGVFDQAGPTIMNNIVANTVTGIQVDAGSAPNTVVDATVFQRNTTNLSGITATNTIALTTAQPLFVAPATGNFYLAPGSLAIDSSRNSLSERASIAAVKSPLAIPVSPIIAPARDRFDQLRVDDPAVPNAIGLGASIFLDRGAIERADFSKPKGRLITPLDNGAGVDGNPALDTVLITSPDKLTQFVLQLTDVGVGIDHNTVTSAAFILRKDGVALVDGVDYQFVYNRNTREVFFQSVSLFAPQSTYTITIPANVVKDLAGNTLQANQTNGSTVFTIIGNAPPSLTQIATFPGLKNIPQVITHAQLLAASDLKVVTLHSAQFRIEAVLGGTLVIRKSGSATAVPVVPGTTIIAAGDTVTWTPPPDLVGITGAFTVVGYDPQNAVIAPALAVSDPPVGVTIDLVDRAPTLTAVDPNKLGSATEDTPFSITYATLLAASNAADANNDQIRFQVESVVAGTQLQISIQGAAPVNVLPGVHLLGPGDRLIWTPPLNGNNQINGGNPLAAFTIVAFDGTNESSPPVQVSINVNPVADAPILTEVDTLSLAGLNSQFKITYATLLAASDLQNVDGHTREFRVQSIPTGAALSIRKAATPLITTPVVPGTTVVSPGDVLIWTPPVGVFGDAVPAFDVVGYDSFNAANFPTVVPSVVVSSPPVTVTVQVLGEIAPRLTTINTLVRPRYVPATITYQNLVDNSDLVFQPGNTVGFRIDRIDQGTLLRNGLAAAVGDVVLPGDTLTFNLLTATGVQDAFDVTAVDINNTLTSLDPVQVRVNLVNVAPTLTRIDTLALAEQETAFTIPYDLLKLKSDASDINGDVVWFKVTSIQPNGTLRIVRGGVSTVATVGTVLKPGESFVWTGAKDIGGQGVNAFTLKAIDPSGLESADPAVQVKIDVRFWGSEFNLSGLWTVGGKLARITQNGANLTFVNQNGVGSTGKYIARDSVSAIGYGLTAKVDVTVADQGRLIFSNGVIWLRISLGGTYVVNNKLATVTQSNDVQLGFVNENGQTSTGSVLTATTLVASNYSGGQATFGDGQIRFQNGQVWRKLDLSPFYTSSIDNRQVRVLQDGTSTLQFVDQLGQTTSGNWATPTTLFDAGRNRTGTTGSGRIVWSDGETWTRNVTLSGTQVGLPTSTTVQIIAIGNTVQVKDAQGQLSTIVISRTTTGTTFRGTSGPLNGKVATVTGGKVRWPAFTWENFDFNALNALISGT